MASSEYNYDEEGETWPFFVLALLTFILLPLTFKYILRIISSSDPITINSKIKGSIKEDSTTINVENKSEIQSFQTQQKTDKIFNKTLLMLIIGWTIVIYIGKYVTKEADMSGMFDPYAILDVSFTSTEKEIKSHYRKLSLKYHPDKLPRDLTQAVRDQMEQEYIKLTSAYKALTDETMRENYLRYGHPDGEQPTSHGIALPKFLVEGKYSSLVVVFYFLIIGVLLPYIVGKWWNNVKSHTRKGLKVETAATFTRRLTDRDPGKVITPNVILDWILESEEVESKFGHLSMDQRRELVYKHFNRDFSDSNIEKDKIKLVSMLPFIIQGFIDIAVVFRIHEIITAAEDLKKSVVSAVKPFGKHQELLQLPYVDAQVVSKQSVKKLGKLFAISKQEAKEALGITDDSKLEKALDIASHIPIPRIVEAEFKVPGEKGVIPPNSSAHLSIKFLIKSPKLKSCPEIEDERLEDEESFEYLKNPMIVNEKQPQLPFAYSPYFPTNFRNSWNCYLIGQTDNKLVAESTAYVMENVDLSNLEISQEVWQKGKQEHVILSTFKVPLTQPVGDVGTYAYRFIMKNNAYFGADIDIPVYLEVKPAPIQEELVNLKKKLEGGIDEDESDSESDISDPEDETLAGALAALRGEKTKSKKIVELSDSDEEDESDAESVFTDINTDTEDEGEN
ncbi:SEC63 [[Candida] subhashii]|uniref:SEC63 n=1 Tax=[Candida] subhashii TaxID=561895 RepID=A0A8J5QQL7_9ASCO|nr:SEC63 [[Candida] subhashii]KAG7665773.1 SEC63 [[Candida] subhashii]